MGGRVAKVPRLLIVSAFFPPSRKIGGRRPERFARHLAARGWDVTVLTLHPRYGLPLDTGWTQPGDVRVIRTHAFMPGNALRGAADTLHRWIARGSRATENGEGGEPHAGELPGGVPSRPEGRAGGSSRPVRDAFWRAVSSVEFPDRWIGWRPFALAAARALKFDAVLATLPPYTPALIARSIAKRDRAVLALDYRDPWTEAPRVDWDPALYAHLLARHRRVEDACLRDADAVFATSPTIGRWLAPRSGIEPVFAPNSFDVRDPSPRKRGNALVYAGTLAYGRSLTPVLEAMARLSDDAAGRLLELVYAGTEGPQVLAEAARLGLSARVKSLGYVSARESDTLTRGALAAVVLVTPRYEYMLPGKLFEVVAAGTPLLLIAPENADVSAICREHRLGWQHRADDVDGIVRSLRQALAGDIPAPLGIETLGTDFVIDRVDSELRLALTRSPRHTRI